MSNTMLMCLESIAPDQQVTQIPVYLLTFFSHTVTEMEEAITMQNEAFITVWQFSGTTCACC